jgi:predicted phage tail protein
MSTDKKATAKKDVSQRDMTLINILDRFSEQISKQDIYIEELAKRQQELISAVEISEQRQHSRFDGTEQSLERFGQDFSRYRSDIQKLVNEQFFINDNLKEIDKRQASIDIAQEKIRQDLEKLEQRFEAQEKSLHTHYEYSLNQSDAFPKKVEEMNQTVAKMHMDTDKRLTEEHKETQRQVDEMNRSIVKMHMDTDKRLSEEHKETQKQLKATRSETMNRLLALDGMEAALREILIRTEPPEKKPFFLLRFVRFIRAGLKGFLAKMKRRRKNKIEK